MIRVLVAEDSLTVRELLVALLSAEPDIEVVGEAKDGAEAVRLAQRLRPDLITMDVNMPVMDGLAATKEIMIAAPTPILIVTGQATQRQIELSLDATRAGALMVVQTPDNPQSAEFERLRKQFLDAVRAMAKVKVVRHWRNTPALRQHASRSNAAMRMVGIGASTGGPAALQEILSALPRNFPLPILVVQHIAPGFINGLAEWLRMRCDLHVKVAEAGETLRPRTAYLAPDDAHLGVTAKGIAVLSDDAAIGSFRPSASFLFNSMARAYARHSLAVILTGMGRDGVTGLHAVSEAGGHIIAQDEETSVVFGMPREAILAGLADEVLPLPSIARRIQQIVSETVNA